MSDRLTHLTVHPHLWRASYKTSSENKARIPSGFTLLDSALGGGWPQAGLIRLRTLQGIGEVELFLTLLQHMCHPHLLVFINPPGRIQASWLIKYKIEPDDVVFLTGTHEQNLWAAEQCLKNDACQIVLVWSGQPLSLTQARRLQVNAKQHQSVCILFEYQHVLRQSLPLELDLSLIREQAAVTLNIEKQLGGWPRVGLQLTYSPIPSNNSILSAFTRYAQTYSKHEQVS
ncbi:recombinase RecA [Alteromonas ponticola]|uniref:Recombinase RecA n=1 Tax=Alteromonas aquimaris TaxID=2998417 RepID=A0ABT3PBL1_9ALTE|nr:recombinase RecA [Alteromonas aquimaris]MCW8109965.1 recombinase RecA [Alteromonas aquimaris]